MPPFGLPAMARRQGGLAMSRIRNFGGCSDDKVQCGSKCSQESDLRTIGNCFQLVRTVHVLRHFSLLASESLPGSAPVERREAASPPTLSLKAKANRLEALPGRPGSVFSHQVAERQSTNIVYQATNSS
jgi:hypothetical protein